MSLLVFNIFLAVLANSESLPSLRYLGNTLSNNSYMYYEKISDEVGVNCMFNSSTCVGGWRDVRGRPVQGANGTTCLYVTTRGYGVISLNRKFNCTPPTSGLWRCDVSDTNSGEIQSLYIYIAINTTHGKTHTLLYNMLKYYSLC